MASPAQAHRIRVESELAAALAADSGERSMEGASVYELMLMKLGEDRRRLKSIQSLASKIEVKKELLPEYIPYIEGVLAGGRGAQDDVLMTVLVWRMDVQDWKGALSIAEYALAHEFTLPDQFKRTLGTVIAEEIADTALKAGSAVPVFALLAFERLTNRSDMPDEVRAKLYKALGYACQAIGSKEDAMNWLNQALVAHDRVGVKKDIERLAREIKAEKLSASKEAEKPPISEDSASKDAEKPPVSEDSASKNSEDKNSVSGEDGQTT